MNILKSLKAINYKAAFEAGLAMAGIEDNKPMWMGTQRQHDYYNNILMAEDLK